MKVYFAAPYAARDVVAGHVDDLDALGLGVKCCSSWLTETQPIDAGTTGAATSLEERVVNEHALADLEDVRAADVLVVFTAASLGLELEETASGGRHVETGYALALGRPVVVVGEAENIFHRSQLVWRVDDWSAAAGVVGAMAVELSRTGVISEPASVLDGPRRLCEPASGTMTATQEWDPVLRDPWPEPLPPQPEVARVDEPQWQALAATLDALARTSVRDYERFNRATFATLHALREYLRVATR